MSSDPASSPMPANVAIEDLRGVIDDIAAKAGETTDQRRRRQSTDAIRELVAAGMTSSKQLRSLVRAKVVAEDELRQLSLVAAELQAKIERQERAARKLSDVIRELAEQNKIVRAVSQFAEHDAKQQALRDSFNASIAEIEQRIQESSADTLEARTIQKTLQDRLQSAIAMQKQSRETHEKEMLKKDREVAMAMEEMLAAQNELDQERQRATLAEAEVELFSKKFDEMQKTTRENTRVLHDLKKQVQTTGRRNKTVQKENTRLASRLTEKETELASVKTQFENFLRRGVVPNNRSSDLRPKSKSSSSSRT